MRRGVASMRKGSGQYGKGEWSAWEGGVVSMGRGSGQHEEEEWSVWADLHTVIGEVMTWWEGRGGVWVGVGVGVGVGVWVCINC